MDETRMAKKHFSKIGGIYFLGSILTFLVQFVVMQIAAVLFPEKLSDMNVALVISSVAINFIALPLIVGMVWRVPAVTLPQHKLGVGKWFVAFLMSYVLMYLTNLLGLFMTGVLGVIKGTPVVNPLEQVVSGLSPVTAFVLMVMLAPVVEEVVFRKVLIDRIAVYGEGIAILISGLMFGMFHGNLNQFAYAFGLGVFFGFIYVKTGRLRYTILLHAAINFMGSIPGIIMLKWMESDMRPFFFYSAFILMLVIAGIICWALHIKKIRLEAGQKEIPKGQRFRTTICNLGMICYLLFWLWQMARQILE